MPDLLDPRTPGVSVSPYPPELQGEAAALHRRRALADMLLMRSMQPLQNPTGWNGIPVPISPFAGLAHIAQAGLGGMAQGGLNRAEGDLATRYSTGLSGAVQDMQDAMAKGDYKTAASVSSKWPALKAVSEKLFERQMPTFHPIESASPTGEPQTTFYDPNKPPAEPIKKPFKMAFENTGGEITPVNPYTQTASLPKTLDPNRTILPEDVEATAHLIGTYKIPAVSPQGMRGGGGAAIMRRVSELYPGYDSKIFNTAKVAEREFASGKQGNTIRSFNVALNHLDTLDKVSDNLGNVQFRPGNQLYNWASDQLGQPAPTEFSAVKKIVGDEIVKAIVGSGGGVTDREEAAATISRANSPEQLKGVIKRYKELMSGQLGGLRQQYIASTGKTDFDKFLTKEGLDASGRPQRRASDIGGLPDAAAIDAELARRKATGG